MLTHLARCLCGCPREAHEHYRPGTDCSLCLCRQYQPWWEFWHHPVVRKLV